MDPTMAPGCTTNMAVVQGHKSRLIATEVEVKDDSQWWDAGDDPTCADGSSVEGACDPSHGEGMDPLHAFNEFDDSDALRCMP